MPGLDSEVKLTRGPSGLGEVRFHKTSVKIIAANGNTYEIAPDKVDERVPRKSLTNIWFKLSTDESKLYSICPASGTFLMQFDGFTRSGEDRVLGTYMKMRSAGSRPADPSTGRKAQKWGEKPPQEQFTAILSIVNGEFQEYSFNYWLPYIFGRKQDTQYAKLFTDSPKRRDRMENFLDMTGWDRVNTPIPWSEDQAQILEYVEERLLTIAPKNRFMGIIKDGYPQQLEPPLEGLVTERPARKRATKKTAKRRTTARRR
jgi:hypothetical protein